MAPRGKSLPVTKRSKFLRANDKQSLESIRKIKASAGNPARELIRKAMKKMKAAPRSLKHFSANGVNGASNKNGAAIKLTPAPLFQDPETELEAAIHRYVDLFDFAPIGYVTFDRVGRIEEINLTALRLLGRSRQRLIGSPFAAHVVKADQQLFLHHLLQCRSSDREVKTELRLKLAKGAEFPVLLSSTTTSSPSELGNALLYRTAIVDLTERKEAEESLRQSEKRYRALFDFVPIAVYTCDADGMIQEFNQRAVELWGREPKRHDSKEKFCGSFKIFYSDGRPMPHPKCPMARSLRGEKVPANDLEILVEQPNGNRRNVLVSPTVLKNKRGSIIGAINCLHDITERKRAEKSLADAAKQQDALHQFVQQRHEAKSLDDIYDAALDAILSTLECDRASILLFDDKGVMRFAGWRGLSEKYRQAAEGHSRWKRNVRNPRPVCIANVERTKLPESQKVLMKSEGIRAAVFIPLLVEGKLIGEFLACYNKARVFRNHELNLALNIAGQLALGIERKRAEQALRESEERSRAIINQTTAGIAGTDLSGRLIFVNQKFCEMLGYTEPEIIGKGILDITHSEERTLGQEAFRKLHDKAEPYEIEKRYVRKDGSSFWAAVSASPIRDAAGKTQAAVAVVLDITDRKKAQAILEERARGLEGEILEISDREQRRLGQDLHDSLCQHLAAVAFMARSMALRLKNHRVLEVDDVDKIAELINEGVTEARTIARGLHPVEMESAGLMTALGTLVNQKHWRVPCRLDADEEISVPDPTIALHLYRIAGEAVINAHKHAGAREIIVGLHGRKKSLELSITDDGKGVKETDINKGSGMGFHIMEYRARSIGARLEIKPIKPHGTRVVCSLPRQ
jgi:PAS domain S-box-containing protein